MDSGSWYPISNGARENKYKIKETSKQSLVLRRLQTILY